MTAQTSDVYSGDLRPDESGEIDVRRYILVLVKWWKEILVISILAGAITGITITWLNSNKTPVYSAEADILIARLLSNIELDVRVNTSVGAGQTDVNGWRVSLLQIARSSAVASMVIDELGDELPAHLQVASSLVDVINATVPLSSDERFASNLIRISATTTDPALSAKIANSWTKHLVDYINGLYGEVPQSTIDSVTAERDDALLAYQMAQKQYEEFVANNQISELTRQIAEKSTLRNEIMVNYTRMVTSMVSSEYRARIQLYGKLTSAPMLHAEALIAAQSEGNVKSLNLLYNLRSSAIAQLNHARIMERSLVDGGEAAAKSNITALQLLKLATFATLQNGEFPSFSLALPGQTQEIDMTLEEQLTDVRALVTVLEEYVAQVEEDIQQLAASTMVGADLATIGGLENSVDAMTTTAETPDPAAASEAYAQLLIPGGVLDQVPVDINSNVSDAHEQLLETLEADIRTLEAAMSAESAKQQQLSHQRDLAWTTYETVGNKLQELSLLRSSANTEVRLGNPAPVPQSPEPTMSPLMPVVALTLLAFLGAVIVALLVDSLGGMPFFTRRPAKYRPV
jgi:uncharacterized protein involved in exopolysaccharide biosynthesis